MHSLEVCEYKYDKHTLCRVSVVHQMHLVVRKSRGAVTIFSLVR